MPREKNLPIPVTKTECDRIVKQSELAGWRVFLLPDDLSSRDDFFDAVRKTFPLDPPLDSNRSWDALSDSLWGGIDSLPDREVLVVWPNSSLMKKLSPDVFVIARDVLADLSTSIADEVTTCGSPKSIVVLLVS